MVWDLTSRGFHQCLSYKFTCDLW